MLPERPEAEAVNSQLANLKQIVAGPDWHTDLGAGANLDQLSEEDPPLSCFWSDIATSVDPASGYGEVTVEWTANVPLNGTGSQLAFDVLADMRTALVTSCANSDPAEIAAGVTKREPGSNYATVTISVVTGMISNGRV